MPKKPSRKDAEIASLRGALTALLRHAEAQECPHEEMYRGGNIWTICDGCGRKWADDEGGFVCEPEPAPIAAARSALSR